MRAAWRRRRWSPSFLACAALRRRRARIPRDDRAGDDPLRRTVAQVAQAVRRRSRLSGRGRGHRSRAGSRFATSTARRSHGSRRRRSATGASLPSRCRSPMCSPAPDAEFEAGVQGGAERAARSASSSPHRAGSRSAIATGSRATSASRRSGASERAARRPIERGATRGGVRFRSWRRICATQSRTLTRARPAASPR